MREDNLRPTNTRTPEEVREIGRRGGIASGESKRRRKAMTEAYFQAMAAKYDIEIDGDPKKMTWNELISVVVRDIMMKRDSCTVSLLKELREATEGSKILLGGEDGGPIPFQIVDPPKHDDT